MTGATPPALLTPWSRPARQAEWETSITVKARGHPQSWIGVGEGGVGFCLFVVLFGLVGFIVVWFLLLLLYLILENAEEMERAARFAGAHFTVFADD